MNNTLYQWHIMEDLQDNYPYYWFGWDGFVPVVCFF